MHGNAKGREKRGESSQRANQSAGRPTPEKDQAPMRPEILGFVVTNRSRGLLFSDNTSAENNKTERAPDKFDHGNGFTKQHEALDFEARPKDDLTLRRVRRRQTLTDPL